MKDKIEKVQSNFYCSCNITLLSLHSSRRGVKLQGPRGLCVYIYIDMSVYVCLLSLCGFSGFS